MTTVADVAAELALPRSTVHRLLLALAGEGFVRRIGWSEFFSLAAGATSLGDGSGEAARALEIASALVDATQ